MGNEGGRRGADTPRARDAQDSVVFSLDSLRAMAEPRASRPAPPRADAAGHFCGTELSGLRTEAPLQLGPPASPVAPRAAVGSSRALTWMIGILLLTTMGLGAYIAIDPRPRVLVTRVAAPDRSEAAVSVETNDIELVPDATGTSATGVDARPAIDDVAAGPEPEVVAPAVGKRHRTGARAKLERGRPAPVAAAPRIDGAALPVACVLDPARAGCAGAVRPAVSPEVVPPKGPPPGANLPETLSQAALRAGIAEVKAAAKQCGGRHGGAAGEKVRIKLSIVGATGVVQSTAAEATHRGTALGNCVAAALKRAVFPRFRKPVIGLEYTITLE